MTQALATTAEPTVTADQMELVRRTVAVGATADELKLYLFDCARQGVHPLDKLVHFTKRNGKYTPITSIDFMRIRAAESGEMAGSDDAVFEEEDDAEHPVAATVTVYRMTQGQRFSYTATARWSEYFPGDNIGFMWRKMPHTMLGKCAEALALRKGFPRQLAGLYAKEEMDQAEAPGAGALSSPAPSTLQPAAATVENRGTPDVVDGPTIDIVFPPGFALIEDYRPDNNWHHITWGRDAKGGSMTYKTKLSNIGNKARAAFNAGAPVRLHSKKFPFLDDVERLPNGDSGPDLSYDEDEAF